jgi:ribonucrease Y
MRIIINPEIISDDKTTILSRDIAKKIEETMQYPGQIKVTVVRETRSVEYAK